MLTWKGEPGNNGGRMYRAAGSHFAEQYLVHRGVGGWFLAWFRGGRWDGFRSPYKSSVKAKWQAELCEADHAPAGGAL